VGQRLIVADFDPDLSSMRLGGRRKAPLEVTVAGTEDGDLAAARDNLR
jgi:hypothetical protein